MFYKDVHRAVVYRESCGNNVDVNEVLASCGIFVRRLQLILREWSTDSPN